VTDTGRLWGLAEEASDLKGRSPLPKIFIDGLQDCLEAGMSCKRISAFLVLAAGVEEMDGIFEDEEMLARAKEILRVVQGLNEEDEEE